MNKNKSFFIYPAPANKFGFGHISRCLVLAEELKNYFNVYFVLDNNVKIKNLLKKKYKSFLFNKKNINKISLYKEKIVFIIDHPEINLNKMKLLNQLSHKTFFFETEDNLTKKYFADYLLNHNINPVEKKNFFNKKKSKVLHGTKFTLIKRNILKLKKKKKKNIKQIIVNFGGLDKKNLTLKFVNSLQKLDKQCSEYKIILVLGPGFKFIKIIKEKVIKLKKIKNIILLKNPNNFYKYLADSSFAIVATGHICYELACLGIPGGILPASSNQKRVYYELAKKNFFFPLGLDFQNLKTFFEIYLKKLTNSKNYTYQSRKLSKLIDGKGSNRILKILQKI